MWIPGEFRTGQKTARKAMGHTFHLTGLVVDGITMSNSVSHVDWDQDPIQLFVCETCLIPGCMGGNWVSIRRAGDHVLLLPTFFRNLEDEEGYEPISLIISKGAMLLDRVLYSDLRRLVPDLPASRDLQPFAGWEAVRLLRFEAPAEILGKRWAPLRFERDLLLATDWASDDRAVAALEGLLEAGLASDRPVALGLLAGARRPVTFYLDQARGFLEWQPLAMGAGPAQLLLAPGYVVEGLAYPRTIHPEQR
jgi:hypothetical protein